MIRSSNFPLVWASCLFVVFIIAACSAAVSSDTELETLVINQSGGREVSYHVEVADTDADRHRGLMFREHLPEDQGMLLDFLRNERAGIWMKNTYVPLDLIFIDGMGKIVYIYEGATPLSTRVISTDQNVRAVLEINAGQVKGHDIRVGDLVDFPSFHMDN